MLIYQKKGGFVSFFVAQKDYEGYWRMLGDQMVFLFVIRSPYKSLEGHKILIDCYILCWEILVFDDCASLLGKYLGLKFSLELIQEQSWPSWKTFAVAAQEAEI